MSTPAPRYDHLLAMSDERGTFEHARFGEPRRSHGYCTDDVARVLVVTARETAPSPALRRLRARSLRFLAMALAPGGAVRNRMGECGSFLDRPSAEDCWGRTVWGLGTVVAGSQDEDGEARLALALFDRAAQQRSRWPRSTAFAALGAAEVLRARPSHSGARALLEDTASRSLPTGRNRRWLWPEERLAYANAVLPEAMIAAGELLDRSDLLERGLELLAWLLDHERLDGHLSVTPVGGAGAGDASPSFDQQPIEVGALGDACARAAALDGDRFWADGVVDAAHWFLGSNDAGVVMWDPATGGGYDGLLVDRANLNCGAESTLALLSTLQHAQRFAPVAS